MPISFIGPVAADHHALSVHAGLYENHDFDRILIEADGALLRVGAGYFRADEASAPDHVERIARIDSNEASAADLLLVQPGSLKQVTQAVRTARRTAAYQGRYPGFLIAVAPVLGATPAAARQRAAGLTMHHDAIPLIGTPEQIARALMDFYDIGIEHILLRGAHPEQDAVEFGRDLIPLMRRKVALRDGMLAMLAG